MVIAALRAMPSSIVSSVYARKRRASCETNDFHALPDGTLNKFLCQWTTSLYALQIALVYVTPFKFPHIKFVTGNWGMLGECGSSGGCGGGDGEGGALIGDNTGGSLAACSSSGKC